MWRVGDGDVASIISSGRAEESHRRRRQCYKNDSARSVVSVYGHEIEDRQAHQWLGGEQGREMLAYIKASSVRQIAKSDIAVLLVVLMSQEEHE